MSTVMSPKSHVTCHMSHVLCQISHVTCHLPPVNNTKNRNNIPSPGNSQIIGSKGRSRSQNLTNHKTTKIVWLHANLAIRPEVSKAPRSCCFTSHRQTNTHTVTQTDMATLWLTQPRFRVTILRIVTVFFFI